MAVRLAHFSMCVSDLERSQRFYAEGLGFEVGVRIPGDDSFAALAELEPPVEMVVQFLEKDGTRLELLSFVTPGVVGEPSTTRNQLGLTHLCLAVDDVDEVAARLVPLGGTVLEHTRSKLVGLTLMLVADPDGVRIELMQMPPDTD